MIPQFHKRPHVLMVSGNAPPVIDGVGDFAAPLLAEMIKQRPDWRYSWLTRRPRWWNAPVVKREGHTVYRPNHTWTERDRRLACATTRWLKPDILHMQEQIHSFYETDAEPRIAKAANCPIVTTLHEYHIELASVVHTNELVKLSSAIIANDTRTAERCKEQTGREVDGRWWSSNTVRARLRHAEPDVITTFGFLSAIKAMSLPLGGLKELNAGGRGLRWRLIGPFRPEINPDHAKLAGLKDLGWVEFTGALFEPELGDTLARSRIMVLPYADGASLRRSTLHVAWAFGIPVITTPPEHNEPVIVEGENCLFVREKTEAAWADAIARVLDNPALEARLSEGGLKTAEFYGWPELSRRYLAIYDRLLAERRKGANA